MITKGVWDRAQAAIRRHNRARAGKYDFPFTGLLTFSAAARKAPTFVTTAPATMCPAKSPASVKNGWNDRTGVKQNRRRRRQQSDVTPRGGVVQMN